MICIRLTNGVDLPKADPVLKSRAGVFAPVLFLFGRKSICAYLDL